MDLLEWSRHVLSSSNQSPAPHHRLLIRELQALSDGENDRLLVHMPPGSAKSTYASMIFPAWWFSQHPGSSVIAASHSLPLASYFGRRVRDLIATGQTELGYELAKGARSGAYWRLSNGGEYFAVGTRGSVIGRRADLIIIDDPIGSLAQAYKATDRKRLYDWFCSDISTRLKPRGRIAIVMTRWHEDDLAGRLTDNRDDPWRVIKLPAIAEENDLLGRKPGEPLWPEWEDLIALQRKKAAVGSRTWFAAYQQSPAPNDKALFKVAHITPIERPTDPSGVTVRAWDLAATVAENGKDPDWTVGVKLRREQDGQFVIMDVVRMRGSPRQVEQSILRTAQLDGNTVHIGFPEDPGQAGKSQVENYIRLLVGFHVIATRETGAKTLRAQILSSQVEGNSVSIVRGDWNRSFLDELADFPFGSNDDQVDALVRAFTTLNGLSTSARKTAVPYMAR